MKKIEGAEVGNANEVVAFFFPRRLGRGAYFVRYCAFFLLIWGLIGASFPISESDGIAATLLFLACIYFTFWVVLPRMRDLSIRPFLAGSLAGSFCRCAFRFDPDVSTDRNHFP